jgi:hypothetical protein
MMKRALYLLGRALVIFLMVANIGLLLFRASDFRTSETGTSAEYWEYLCGVQLPEFHGHYRYAYSGDAYPIADNKAYYFNQEHHGSTLYSVPLAEVLADLPRVKGELSSPQPPPTSSCERFDSRSLCELYKQGAPRRSECASFFETVSLDSIGAKELERLRMSIVKTESTDKLDQTNAEFNNRINRGKRVCANFVFEAVYLSGWLLFVAGFRPLRVPWLWRMGFAPFLLFLPYFLGYAPMTFTYGPSGGFVYPIYLILAWLPMQIVPCSSLDRLIGQFLPDLLSGLNQLPGSPVAWSFMGAVGPASSLGFGLLLVALSACILAIQKGSTSDGPSWYTNRSRADESRSGEK